MYSVQLQPTIYSKGCCNKMCLDIGFVNFLFVGSKLQHICYSTQIFSDYPFLGLEVQIALRIDLLVVRLVDLKEGQGRYLVESQLRLQQIEPVCLLIRQMSHQCIDRILKIILEPVVGGQCRPVITEGLCHLELYLKRLVL